MCKTYALITRMHGLRVVSATALCPLVKGGGRRGGEVKER